MNCNLLFAILNQLNLPKGEWAVFGGACLTARGIRPTDDIELFVTLKLFNKLFEIGWEKRISGSTQAKYLTRQINNITVNAFINCGSEKWVPKPNSYISNPEIINGQPFMPLDDMYAWKKATARPKDLIDLKLIDEYRSNV